MEAHANPEDFDLYALGALDGEDRQRFEEHLRSCEACQQQLAKAQALGALIGMTAPEAAPPPSIKARLMNEIKNEKAAHEQAASQPQRKRARWGLRFSLGFAVTTILLALLCSWLWTQNAQHEQHLSRIMVRMHKLQTESQQRQTEIQAITKVMGAPDTEQVSLAHQAGTPPGSAQVFYNARLGIVVYTGTIAPAPSDKSYQLWLVPDTGSPVSAGMVEANQGAGASVAHLPQGLAAKAFAVTLEPKGGQPQPTGPKVLVGAAGNA